MVIDKEEYDSLNSVATQSTEAMASTEATNSENTTSALTEATNSENTASALTEATIVRILQVQ